MKFPVERSESWWSWLLWIGGSGGVIALAALRIFGVKWVERWAERIADRQSEEHHDTVGNAADESFTQLLTYEQGMLTKFSDKLDVATETILRLTGEVARYQERLNTTEAERDLARLQLSRELKRKNKPDIH